MSQLEYIALYPAIKSKTWSTHDGDSMGNPHTHPDGQIDKMLWIDLTKSF